MIAPIQDPTPPPVDPSIYTEETFRFLALPEGWVLALVVVPALLWFAWWSYGGLARLERGTRAVLSVLRGLAIAVALLLLFQPAIERVRYSTLRTQVHVLVDDSASMQRKDTYPDDPEQQRALAETAGVPVVEEWTRSQLVAKVLQRTDGMLERLRKTHDVRVFRFVRKPVPVGDLEELTARGSRSPIGDALDLHLAAVGGAPLDALLLVSDGRNNAGVSPVDVAAKYRSNDTAIHAVGIGDPNPPRNVRISGPPGPREALRLEEVAFDVTVSAEGLADRTVSVTLSGARDGGTPQPLASTTATLLDDGLPQKVRLYHAFEEAGDWTLRFEVGRLPEETTHEDNVDTRFLRVNDERIRVLYVDGAPRWEYRYLKNAVLRVDDSIEAQVYLFDASKDFAQEHSDHLRPLDELPSTKEELFAYHVLLLGDIPPEQLAPTEAQRQAWLDLVVQFVEFGGGLGVLWGPDAMPERYRGTPLVDLLPVVLEQPGTRAPAEWIDPFFPQLEHPDLPHDIVLLMRDPKNNEALWSRGLAPLVAYYPVRQAKAGAQVLLRHPSEGNRFGKLPLLVASEFPRGRTLFLATDETWRWRETYGEKYHDVFWRNVVRHLAAGRLRRKNDRLELRVDKVIIETGEQVRVSLQVLDAEFDSRRGSEHAVFFLRPGGEPERRTLQATSPGGETGEYEGRFTMVEPGVVSILVFEGDNPAGEALAREDVLVKIPDAETASSSQDRQMLERIAAASKDGEYVFLSEVDRLLERFANRKPYETEVDRSTRPLWDHWWSLMALLALLTAEWILRKRARLV